MLAGDMKEDAVEQCLNVLRKESLISLITAKDKEGDTPLHSAARSGAKPQLIKLLLNAVSGTKTKHRLLQERNKHSEVPLVSAFNLQRWSIVELLLEESIKQQVLLHLTGHGEQNCYSESKTLLHKAMQRGLIPYLKIYLRVCRRCTNSIPVKAMNMCDKRRYTPWYYFLSLNDSLIEEGLKCLKEYGVDINKLVCDLTGRATLLHEAYRRERHRVCKLLVKFGAKRDRKDANRLVPHQRRRVVSCDSKPSTPTQDAFPVHTALR